MRCWPGPSQQTHLFLRVGKISSRRLLAARIGKHSSSRSDGIVILLPCSSGTTLVVSTSLSRSQDSTPSALGTGPDAGGGLAESCRGAGTDFPHRRGMELERPALAFALFRLRLPGEREREKGGVARGQRRTTLFPRICKTCLAASSAAYADPVLRHHITNK